MSQKQHAVKYERGDSMLQVNLGLKIQALRKQLGFSQEKFALQINMDRTYFASIESGKRNVSLNNIEKLRMGLELHYLSFFLIYIAIMKGNKRNERFWNSRFRY